MSKTQNKSRLRGFTLIELLVVIAIIALLAAILFPVFARARENARRSSCQSNLKQISLGLFQYTQDYDEKLPVVYSSRPKPSASAYAEGWATMIMPYMKSVQILQCPSEPNKQNLLPDGAGAPDYGYSDYFMNGNLGPYTCPSGNNSCGGPGVNIAAVANTAVVIMTGDSGHGRDYTHVTCYAMSGCGAGTTDMGGDIPPGLYCAKDGTISAAVVNAADLAALNPNPMQRHFDGANYSFVDGHVKWFKRDAITYSDPATSGKPTLRIN